MGVAYSTCFISKKSLKENDHVMIFPITEHSKIWTQTMTYNGKENQVRLNAFNEIGSNGTWNLLGMSFRTFLDDEGKLDVQITEKSTPQILAFLHTIKDQTISTEFTKNFIEELSEFINSHHFLNKKNLLLAYDFLSEQHRTAILYHLNKTFTLIQDNHLYILENAHPSPLKLAIAQELAISYVSGYIDRERFPKEVPEDYHFMDLLKNRAIRSFKRNIKNNKQEFLRHCKEDQKISEECFASYYHILNTLIRPEGFDIQYNNILSRVYLQEAMQFFIHDQINPLEDFEERLDEFIKKNSSFFKNMSFQFKLHRLFNMVQILPSFGLQQDDENLRAKIYFKMIGDLNGF